MSEEKTEAVQTVVDRVAGNWDAAPESTVADELRSGLEKAGLDLPDDDVRRLADAIDDAGGRVDVTEVLAG
jgi:hypothetical protein